MLNTKMKKALWSSFTFLLVAFTAKDSFTQSPASLRQQDPDAPEMVNDTTVQKLVSADSSLALAAVPQILFNKAALKFANDYVKQNRQTLAIVEQRSKPFFELIDSVFTSYQLPPELKYLAVVESKLKPNVVSKAGAVGLWQFMPSTARTVGLKIKGKYDERRLTCKSTVAAARHLKALYNDFEDWLLVIAAYNGGAGTVYKAIRRSGSRDFWKLQYFLPLETRLHVKRFIGTHYYFEGGAGLTTITKAETTAYRKQLEETVEK